MGFNWENDLIDWWISFMGFTQSISGRGDEMKFRSKTGPGFMILMEITTEYHHRRYHQEWLLNIAMENPF